MLQIVALLMIVTYYHHKFKGQATGLQEFPYSGKGDGGKNVMAPLSIPVPHRENVSQNIEELGTEVLLPKKNEKSRLKWVFNFEISLFYIFWASVTKQFFRAKKIGAKKNFFGESVF